MLVLAASRSKDFFPNLRRSGLATAGFGIDSKKHGSSFKDGAGGPAQSDATPKAAALKKIVLARIRASTLESTDWVLCLLRADVQSVQCGKAIHQNSRRALYSVRMSSGRPLKKKLGRRASPDLRDLRGGRLRRREQYLKSSVQTTGKQVLREPLQPKKRKGLLLKAGFLIFVHVLGETLFPL